MLMSCQITCLRPTYATALVLALMPLFHGCAAHRSLAELRANPAKVATQIAISEKSSSVKPADAETSATRVSNLILTALVEANGVPGMGAAVWRW